MFLFLSPEVTTHITRPSLACISFNVDIFLLFSVVLGFRSKVGKSLSISAKDQCFNSQAG